MYGMSEVDTCNKARVKLFCIGRAHKALPPTSDATKFHIMRAHYQTSVWNQAHLPCPDWCMIKLWTKAAVDKLLAPEPLTDGGNLPEKWKRFKRTF